MPLVQSGDDTLTCFTGAEAVLANPGCFTTSNPSQPGDCSSTTSQYLVQYLFPSNTSLMKLSGFSFISNDGNTVFPSAGALSIPVVDGSVRFPTAQELSSLQVTNIATPGDLGEVFVDLSGENIVVGPDTGEAVVLVLQFPAGQLVAQNDGPGIAVESSDPDEDCDFFTIDGGASGTWFSPAHDPQDPNSLPLDWGFAASLEPLAVPIQAISWSSVKTLYHRP